MFSAIALYFLMKTNKDFFDGEMPGILFCIILIPGALVDYSIALFLVRY